jgi:hypothetical protein
VPVPPVLTPPPQPASSTAKAETESSKVVATRANVEGKRVVWFMVISGLARSALGGRRDRRRRGLPRLGRRVIVGIQADADATALGSRDLASASIIFSRGGTRASSKPFHCGPTMARTAPIDAADRPSANTACSKWRRPSASTLSTDAAR